MTQPLGFSHSEPSVAALVSKSQPALRSRTHVFMLDSSRALATPQARQECIET